MDGWMVRSSGGALFLPPTKGFCVLPIHTLNIASTTQKNPLLEAVVDQKSKHKQWRQVGREVGSMDHSYRIGHDYIERWSGLEGPVGFCSKFSVLLYFKYIDTAEI